MWWGGARMAVGFGEQSLLRCSVHYIGEVCVKGLDAIKCMVAGLMKGSSGEHLFATSNIVT